MHFDSLEIQQKIEEKRLILGQKFENFLIKNFSLFCEFLKGIFCRFFAKKEFIFISCLAIIFLSIFVQSSRDIGPDSGTYIEMAQKILAGGKYYDDFFENNFPFAIYLTAVPIFFANAAAISPVLALQLFINLLGIASIYSCVKILYSPKAAIPISDSLKKIIIISFCFAYFIRIYTLQFNEYGTKSSYFLALALPYICFHLTKNNSQILTGILAGLIICLKPHYAILIFAIEIYLISLNKFRNRILCNLIALSIIALYIFLIKEFIPEYFTYLPQFSALYFEFDRINYFPIFKEDLFPILIFITLTFHIIKNNFQLKILLLTTIACSAIIASELLGNYDQRFIFFCFVLPLIFTTFYLGAFQNYTQPQTSTRLAQIAIALLCLALPQFDAKNIFPFLLNLCCFWWISLFFLKKINWPLTVLALASIAISLFDNSGKISWIFCALISLFMLNKYQKFLPKTSLILISLTCSYLASLISATIFNHQNLYAANLKSPNFINDEKINFIKKYAPKENDNVAIISDEISEIYPAFTYLDKHNLNAAHSLYSLYPSIKKKNNIEKKAANYLFLKTIEEISSKNNKLIFIKEHLSAVNACSIGFLELSLQDKNFRNIFLQNYEFLNRIIYIKNQDDKEFIAEDIEIYIRTN